MTTRSDLLPGVDLVTEEVEPGVYRVLGDGTGRDLTDRPPTMLAFGPDGKLILFAGPPGMPSQVDHFFTLGEPDEQALGGRATRLFSFAAGIDDDGDVIARLEDRRGKGKLARFDDRGRTDLAWPNGSTRVGAIEVAEDGSVWVARTGGRAGLRVARIVDDALSVLPIPPDSRGSMLLAANRFAVAPDGTVWVGSHDADECGVRGGLAAFDGGAWRMVDLPIDASDVQVGPLAVGPEGTLWVYATRWPGLDVPRFLLRLRDGEWDVFSEDEGVPYLTGCQEYTSRVTVDDEGTLWIAHRGTTSFDGDGTYVGVLSFDGSTWRQYLRGHLVEEVVVGPEGSVWAASQADCSGASLSDCDQSTGDGLYVITPEAVAATE